MLDGEIYCFSMVKGSPKYTLNRDVAGKSKYQKCLQKLQCKKVYKSLARALEQLKSHNDPLFLAYF